MPSVLIILNLSKSIFVANNHIENTMSPSARPELVLITLTFIHTWPATTFETLKKHGILSIISLVILHLLTGRISVC